MRQSKVLNYPHKITFEAQTLVWVVTTMQANNFLKEQISNICASSF